MNVIKGVVSGLLLGLGVVLMLIVYGAMAAGTKAPWVVMGVAVLVGAALGVLSGRRQDALA